MAARLPSSFGMDGGDYDSDEGGSRVTASGFTESTARNWVPNKRTEPFPLYSEPQIENNNVDMRGLADMIRSMNEKVNKLESVVSYNEHGRDPSQRKRLDSAIDDDATQITQKIKGLNIGSKSTVVPNDSVSNYGNRQVGSQIHEDQTFIQSVASKGGSLYDNVIGGYAQTPEEKMEELEALTKIRKIHGLPQIFLNERLNFLIHLHKPLMVLLGIGDQYPSEDTLYRIDDFMKRKANKVRTQHEDLLYAVIETTVKRGRIRANPHNLPILEVGMSLTDKVAFLCFSALYKEFQNEWFQSMKDIDAPKFHNSYSNFQSRRPAGHKSSGSKHSGYKKAQTSGSVISLFRH